MSDLIIELNKGRKSRGIIQVMGNTYMTPGPRIHCKDGFSISIQGSNTSYCSPRESLLDMKDYTELELGFPSEMDTLIEAYAEEEGTNDTVFPYVPVKVIEALVAKHGGVRTET